MPKNLTTISVAEAIARTRFSRYRVYALCASGEWKTVRTTERGSFRILEASMERWFEAQTTEPLPRVPARSVLDADDELDAELPVDERVFS